MTRERALESAARQLLDALEPDATGSVCTSNVELASYYLRGALAMQDSDSQTQDNIMPVQLGNSIMKIECKQDVFKPITITLETQEEVDGLCELLSATTSLSDDAIGLDTMPLFKALKDRASLGYTNGKLEIKVVG